MKFERIRLIAETVGVLSIVASLIFVGVQLKQTQQSLDMDRILTEMTIFQELQSRIIENPDFAEVMVKARRDSSSLTDAERMQALAWLEEWLAQIATYGNENRVGVLSNEGLARRMRNECWFYYDYRELFDDIRDRRDFFQEVDTFCTED
jgi:hypothetical protein